jgi:hypothetical protein
MEAAFFVPAHAPATEDIRPLAQYNIDKVEEIAQRILALCSQPQSFEELLQKLFVGFGLTMNFEQYALVGSTVRSYLSWLLGKGELEAFFDQNRLLWRRG